MGLNKIFEYLGYLIWIPLLLMFFIVPGGVSLLLKMIVAVLVIFLILILLRFMHVRKNSNDLKRIENEYLKNPDNLNKFLELGYAAFNARDFDKAYSVFNKISNQFPNQPAGYCGLGILELEKKNYKKAKSYFEKTIDLDSNYTIAKEKLDFIEKKSLA